MSAPTEIPSTNRHRLSTRLRWLGIALFIGGMLSGAFHVEHGHITMAATYTKQVGGSLPGGVIVILLGVALIVGSVHLADKAKDSPTAMARYHRNSDTYSHGETKKARLVAIHGKQTLFGPWLEVYATFEVLEPAYTTKTTVVVNENEIKTALPIGETIDVWVDKRDREELALR